MRRTVLIILGVAGGLVLLLIVALAIAIRTIDPATWTAPIRDRVKRETGRELAIGGIDVKLSLEPRIELSDVSLSNVPGGSAPQMLTAKRIDATVAALPLLSRRVDVVRLTLVEPEILLETDRQGRGNWELSGNAPRSAPTPAEPGAGTATFGVGDLAVERGRLTWRDGASGSTTVVMIDALRVRARERAGPVAAEFKGSVDGMPVAIEGQIPSLAAIDERRYPLPLSVKGDVGGRRTTIDAKVTPVKGGAEVRDLALAIGQTRLDGSVAIDRSGARPKVVFDLKGETVALADLALPRAAGNGPAKPAPAATNDDRVFPATPLPLNGLRKLDASGRLDIGRVVPADGRPIAPLFAEVRLDNGRLVAKPLRVGTMGGRFDGELSIDASPRDPEVAIRGKASGLDLGSLLASAGVRDTVKGGATEVTLDVAGRGDDLHAIASTLRGSVIATVGRAELAHGKSGLSPELQSLLEAVNPYRKAESATTLECAVARLPIRDGVAHVDRSIGFETGRLGATASGTIDFGRETLDLNVTPNFRSGPIAGLDLGSLASLVHVQGPLRSPKVGIDPLSSTAVAGRISGVISRRSLAGLAGGGAPGGDECAIAMGRAPAKREAPAPSAGTPAPALPSTGNEQVDRALRGLFRR